MTRRPQRHVILTGEAAEKVRAYARWLLNKGRGDELLRVNVRTAAASGDTITLMPWNLSAVLHYEAAPPRSKYVSLSARNWIDMFRGVDYL